MAHSKIHTVLKEFKGGELHSGKSGKIVKNRKQAIAIALSEARLAGEKIPFPIPKSKKKKKKMSKFEMELMRMRGK